MKALIQKELRENLTLALAGLFIFGLLLAGTCRANLQLAGVGFLRHSADTPSLIASNILWDATFFCAIFGAILGWVQIHRESHRDLWAFLVHRPVARTGILRAKVAAGLALYFLAAGLPLLGLILWVRVPGHVPTPFEWAMVLPVTADFLAGIVYYLAGMLTALRQVRWYASRSLGLGVPVAVSLLVHLPEFWQALAAILAGGAMLATAVWGGFQSDGQDDAQPALGRVGLTAALTVGGFVVSFLAVSLVAGLLGSRNTLASTNYEMTKVGTIYHWIQEPGKPTRLTDLNGLPLMDEKTGHPMEAAEFNLRSAPKYWIYLDAGGQRQNRETYRESARFFNLWQATGDTVWYYWRKYGRLAAYDLGSHRLQGSLGPQGFANTLSVPEDRFERLYWSPYVFEYAVATGTNVYQVDLRRRTCRIFFNSTVGDPIRCFQEIAPKANTWEYAVVVTKGWVQLLTPDGKVVWKTPFEPPPAEYTTIQVSILDPADHYALWISPSPAANQRAGGKLPIYVSWLQRDQGLVKAAELPGLPPLRFLPGLAERLVFLVSPPWMFLVLGSVPVPGNAWEFFAIGLASATVCAGWGWWLGRRFAFTLRARLGWAVFHWVFGFSGFLAFLSVCEWRARLACPNCHGLRVVNRRQCEHCGAEFAPPEKTGTEIFEPMPVN